MLKSSFSKWFAASVFTLALVAIAFALNMKRQAPHEAKVVREDGKTDEINPASVTVASMPPSEEDTKANFSLDWYESPNFAESEKYAASTAAIDWDETCKGHSVNGKQDELARLIRSRTGVSGEAQFPRDVNIEEISQFWQEGKTYYQMSASWEQSTPSTYRIEYYSSEKSDFSSDVKSLRASDREHLSASAALGLIADTLANAKAHGAKEGSRILLVNVASERSDGEPHRVRFLNSQATEYTSEDVDCKFNRQLRRARCRCFNPREAHR